MFLSARFLLLISVSLLPTLCWAADKKYKGWDFLVQNLKAEGIPTEQIDRVFTQKSFPRFENVPFGLERKDAPDPYSVFFEDKKIAVAEKCLRDHKDYFLESEKNHGVSRFTVAAILLVETQCGKITGNRLVIHRLARLASLADPENIKWNVERLKKEDPDDETITIERAEKRAEQLYNIFFPEVIAAYEVAKETNTKLFDMKGSIAGAFGISQFLPTSFLRYAVDGNGDGKRSLFDHPDAIASTAHYLKQFGWRDDLSYPQKETVVWYYNRSEPYIDTVLELANRLEQRYHAGLSDKDSKHG